MSAGRLYPSPSHLEAGFFSRASKGPMMRRNLATAWARSSSFAKRGSVAERVVRVSSPRGVAIDDVGFGKGGEKLGTVGVVPVYADILPPTAPPEERSSSVFGGGGGTYPASRQFDWMFNATFLMFQCTSPTDPASFLDASSDKPFCHSIVVNAKPTCCHSFLYALPRGDAQEHDDVEVPDASASRQ